MTFKPMLAATVTDRAKLRFPFLASPKLDGIRCIIRGGKVLSRSLKPIRNEYIRNTMQAYPDMDGELISGVPYQGDVLNRTTRAVMTAHGHPEFTFHAFDTLHDLCLPFQARLELIPKADHNLAPVPHSQVNTLDDLARFETEVLALGYEGVMLRDPMALYKFGRATPGEGSLWKLKQFMDGELLVTGLREGQMNNNFPTTDALGRTVRSKHQDGMIPNKQVGTILGYDIATGQQMEVSPGRMTVSQRIYFWLHQNELVGAVIKYKAFNYGSINVPRFATFQAFRDPDDM